MPASRRDPPKCQVCKEQSVKYKCPSCPVRYCSVNCYKKHKAQTCRTIVPSPTDTPSNRSATAGLLPSPSNAETSEAAVSPSPVRRSRRQHLAPLKPLTEVRWPPEPDPGIFTDPLLREDPKPLRREELMRIATSPRLRNLLSTPTVPHILRILDSLPSPQARSASLSRLLSIDEVSLSKPGGGVFLTESSSPPPLHEILASMSGEEKESAKAGSDQDGWWLGREGSKEGRIWIGDGERRLMRMWAGIVCGAIDGKDRDGEAGWGEGPLAWEV